MGINTKVEFDKVSFTSFTSLQRVANILVLRNSIYGKQIKDIKCVWKIEKITHKKETISTKDQGAVAVTIYISFEDFSKSVDFQERKLVVGTLCKKVLSVGILSEYSECNHSCSGEFVSNQLSYW